MGVTTAGGLWRPVVHRLARRVAVPCGAVVAVAECGAACVPATDPPMDWPYCLDCFPPGMIRSDGEG